MAAPALPGDAGTATARPPLLDRWTWIGLGVVIAPLLVWTVASTYLFVTLCHVTPWLAWVPAVSTTGVTLVTVRVMMRAGLAGHVRRYARYLAGVAVSLDMLVSGAQHAMPATIPDPGWYWKFFIGFLPALMGALTAHLCVLVRRQEQEADEADRRAVIARAEAAVTATRDQEAAQRERANTLAHETRLTELAAQRRDAENTALTLARARAQAEQTVATATGPNLHAVPAPAVGNIDALGRKARPSKKRDAALRWLLARHRDGRDLTTISAAEVDRAIGANGYSKKSLATWIADVTAYARRAA